MRGRREGVGSCETGRAGEAEGGEKEKVERCVVVEEGPTASAK